MTDRKSRKIVVEGIEIVTFKQNDSDYISLTDMAKFKSYDSGVVIANWLSTKYTIQFMGVWEQVHNPNFNLMEFNKIRNEAGSNGFIVSSSFWIKQTRAIGIKSNAGRYGGTYAHKDIAFEFATWLSPEFKLYLIKEFQRLKEVESQKLALGWDVKRTLTKINYKIHTDAIKKHLIPENVSKNRVNMVYASEADVLNVALFAKTAKEWKDENPIKEGINAKLIRQGLPQSKRLIQLNEIAIVQMRSLVGNAILTKLT